MPRRPSDQFGTPSQKDGTARLERIVDIASNRGAEALKDVGKEYPRPIGSRRMNPEHEAAEFEMMKDYPDMIADLAAQNEWSLETFVSYLERMAKRT